ncbi:MAG: PAS domain-containing sensor histidine kinase [Robiginitomaculum sp.]|nr:PAS domain-containing sensor histidine kinase [Robiginitomaculum sp.]MDQ7078214.1 PAS domain-containing sensor histidine kinase [Robiginitomaculum sp.]
MEKAGKAPLSVDARFARPVNLLSSALFGAFYAIAIVITALGAFFALSGAGRFGPGSSFLVAVLVGNLLLILGLAGYVILRLGRLWVMRSHDEAAPRLHLRFAGMFSMAAVFPAIIVAIFFAVVYTRGIEYWFSDRVATLTNNIVSVARATLQAQADEVYSEIPPMANDLSQPEAVKNFIDGPIIFTDYLRFQAERRFFQAAYILHGNGTVLRRVEAKDAPPFLVPSAEAFAAAGSGRVNLQFDSDQNLIRGLIKLSGYEDAYLYVVRFATGRSLSTLAEASQALDAFQEAENRRGRLAGSFALIYLETALLVLIGAIWVGLAAATRIVLPIGKLAQAAQRVRDGDLMARVGVGNENDEVAELSRDFNEMTSQLQSQRQELISAHQESESRRLFIETVLSGVSAGVLDLDAQGRIGFANPSALALLGCEEDDLKGKKLQKCIPEFTHLLSKAKKSPDRKAEGQVELSGKDGGIHLNTKVAPSGRGKRHGYVITFDDMSRAIAAQRSAAWREVARRIAHEIKNPLTPIQLSAERLRRKYRTELKTDGDVFDKCIKTIVRQVSDIGRMVDEFSSFARMPVPKSAAIDLAQLVRDAVFAQHVAFPDIRFNTEIPNGKILGWGDERLASQAVGNILKNAAEAILGAGQSGEINVTITQSDHGQVVKVIDNGPGWPSRGRERLLEPYMTTRAKGTGLGLAIVNRIMEDHDGDLRLLDREDGLTGAVVALRFPLPPEEKTKTANAKKTEKREA